MSFADRPWGGASKVSTSQRASFDRLADTDNPHKFDRLFDVFHTAAALGICLHGRAEPGGKREELMNVYSMDPDGVLWAVMSGRYPEASSQERFELLMAHADWGVQRLAEEYEVFGGLQEAIDSILS